MFNQSTSLHSLAHATPDHESRENRPNPLANQTKASMSDALQPQDADPSPLNADYLARKLV